MTPSKILFFLCISFVAGIFLESLVKIPQIFVWGFLFVAIVCIFFPCLPAGREFFIRRMPIAAGFCILFLVLGILRFQISEFNIANDKLSKFNDKGPVIITGVIADEPNINGAYQKIKIKVNSDTVLVTTKRYPEYKYLDKLKLTGKLETPTVIGDFNYKNYLLKDHIYSVMAFPKIEAEGKARRNLFSIFYSGVLFCKQKIRTSIRQNFLPPQSSILEGTILGDNGAMDDDLKSKLNITGLRHIIAVSGTHVVILSAIIMSLLINLGFSRGRAFYIVIIFICVYIILTGLPPSGVRAGIMGGTFLLAQKLGRQTAGSRIIVIAGALMLLANPLLLIYDVGFQLSFLAVLGLIYLEPIIRLLIKNSIISTTLAAQIFTLPIMVYNFGNISFVSLITNLLVLPIVYLLMVFGFLASIAGIISVALGWILSIPCHFLLSYFMLVINFFSKPWMAKIIPNISWVWVFVLYLVIVFGAWFLNKKFSQKFV